MIFTYKYLKEFKLKINIKRSRNPDPIICRLSNTHLNSVSPRKKS